MRLRLLKLWLGVRASYWFVPSLMTIGAIVLAFVMVQIDQDTRGGLLQKMGWMYAGGPEGARAVLATVAGSVMSTAGVTFSITIASLSLASGQFGPRLLNNFMRDTGNQIVLGTFIATFLYCLLVLRTVRGTDGSEFVPSLSVTVGVGLGLASLGVLIYFVDHLARSIQAPNVVAAVARDLHHSIESLYPTRFGREAPEVRLNAIEQEIPPRFETEARTVPAAENGYIQAIDQERLMHLATEHDLLLRLDCRPGDFVVRGTPLVRGWPPNALDQELTDKLHDTFALGTQRTATQDVEYSINQLVEVAVRALSPGINDPFTAMQCLDQLAATLSHLVRQNFPAAYRFDEQEKLRVIATCLSNFPGVLDAAFNQIRQYGRDSAAVTIRMLEVIATILRFARSDEDRAALLRHAEIVRRGAMEALPEPQDRQDVETRFRSVLRLLDVQPGNAPLPEAKQPV